MSEEAQLDFENQIFVEVLAEDGLVVLARYSACVCFTSSSVLGPVIFQRTRARAAVSETPQAVL